MLAAEAEEEVMKLVSGQGPVVKAKREDSISLPSCTSKGANYAIECLTTAKKEGEGYTSGKPHAILTREDWNIGRK